MKVLLIYPIFPQSFWSFEKTLQLAGKKAMLPPLGLITVAALLPQDWEMRLVDRNVTTLTDEDWEWADMVFISGMIVQSGDFLELVQESKRRGKPGVVGGPYATSMHEEFTAAGADYLVLDEGEITIPMFLEALERGETSGTFRSTEKPDVTKTPIPRFDLLEMDAYLQMAVQFSRGCPFQCEFCDIIVLYGRKPRTKEPKQLIAELERLYELGWRQPIFMVDDNFIGNKRNVKQLLREMIPWMEERGYPFSFDTEASVDLAKDQELMDLMTAARFKAVFLGIETPDEDSLALTKKYQNTRDPLSESINKIVRSGIRVMAGFIVGFDGEKPGAGQRIVDFVKRTTIPAAFFSMLQALPNTALWKRLSKEGRLRSGSANVNQTTLMNFIPTRPVEQITQEYIDGFTQLYDPECYLDRTYQHYRILGTAPCNNQPPHKRALHRHRKKLTWTTFKALLTILWRQGVVRKTRTKFWSYLWNMLRHNRRMVASYLGACAHVEHFIEYRDLVKHNIEEQLQSFLAEEKQHQSTINYKTKVTPLTVINYQTEATTQPQPPCQVRPAAETEQTTTEVETPAPIAS